MYRFFPALLIISLAAIAPVEACRLPPKSLLVPPGQILAALDTQAQPVLKAMDDFAGIWRRATTRRWGRWKWPRLKTARRLYATI